MRTSSDGATCRNGTDDLFITRATVPSRDGDLKRDSNLAVDAVVRSVSFDDASSGTPRGHARTRHRPFRPAAFSNRLRNPAREARTISVRASDAEQTGALQWHEDRKSGMLGHIAQKDAASCASP